MIIVFTLPVCTAACSLNPANPRRYPGIAPPIPAANLDEKLDNAEIPYECVGGMGAAMAIKAGPYLENYQFYVPYAYYPKAKNIIDEMFSQDQTAE